MRTTFSIGFYCRESKTDKKGFAPVEMGITINGQRTFLSLNRKETPCAFKKAMSSKRDNPIKEYCRTMENNINSSITNLMKEGKPVTSQNVKLLTQTGGVDNYTVGKLFNDYLSYYKKRIGIDLTAASYRKFELSKELFLKLSTLKEEDNVTSITNHVVLDYYAELRKSYKTASSASYMAKLKTVVKFALDNGKLTVNPFSTVKIKHDKPDIDVLSENEIKQIKNVQLPYSLERVRDVFVFQICSGLSFIDIEHVTKEDIQEKDGIYFIQKNRIKSGVEYTSILLPGAIEILKKYNWRLPVISNQKSNLFLKVIKNLSCIEKNLHTHIGRHTYAYLLLNKYKIRAETTARAMGHTSPKTTLKYYANISADTTVHEIGNAIKELI